MKSVRVLPGILIKILNLIKNVRVLLWVFNLKYSILLKKKGYYLGFFIKIRIFIKNVRVLTWDFN